MHATRGSWKNSPLSSLRAQLQLDRTFSQAEFEALRAGHVPFDMDDKWFVFMEDERLHLHRSWTGNCIYEVQLASSGEGYRITEAWVTRDASVYKSQGDEKDGALLGTLLDQLARPAR
jgi:hypothetical protein